MPACCERRRRKRANSAAGCTGFRWCADASGARLRGSCVIARSDYLDAADGRRSPKTSCAPFWTASRKSHELRNGRNLGSETGIQLELLERMAAPSPASWPELITSLRQARRDGLEGAVRSGEPGGPRAGATIPPGAYSGMDFESRDQLSQGRRRLGEAQLRCGEPEVAEAAVELARERRPVRTRCRGRPARRAHVGFYLIDRGLAALRQRR